MRINIVFSDNRKGLTQDARVLRTALTTLGCAVTLSPQSPMRPPWSLQFVREQVAHAGRVLRDRGRIWAARIGHSTPWDVNVFLERTDPDYVPLARANWFIPNQEWLTAEDRRRLADMDLVLFKSKSAENVLRGEMSRSAYLGFTSEDRRLPNMDRDWRGALHVAGWNPLKGTSRLLDVWQRRADWPALSVVAEGHTSAARNIRITGRPVSDQALQLLQNRCGIHLAPSEVEGFGHSLNEALSCGAVLITTDAPPMNELGDDDAVIRVPFAFAEPMALGTRYLFSKDALENAVDDVLSMPERAIHARGAAARQAYEDGRAAFLDRLGDMVASLGRG